MGAASIFNLLNLSRFRWPNSSDEDDKVNISNFLNSNQNVVCHPS